jgi:orotate phosphoribosyltransferase
MHPYQLAFIDLALRCQALRFGRFTLKSGRDSPYFFNAGCFSNGEALRTVGQCYAAAIDAAGIDFEMLFGPAYKGIPLATATAVALHEKYGRSIPLAFNRKEAKDHGEGGSLSGAPLRGRVLIVDDVITAGTAVRESLELIRAAGAQPVGVALALDRQERGQGTRSAVQELEQREGLKCVSIVTLGDLIEALERSRGVDSGISADQLTALRAYRAQYGVS